MQYDEIVTTVDDRLGLGDRERAGSVVTDTLDLLGQRLAGGEPVDLAAQLPAELKETLDSRRGDAEAFDVDEFLRRLADRQKPAVSPDQARHYAQAVFGTLGRFVSEGELRDVREQLPAGFAPLFV